jgi:hypothetical protein
VPVLLVLVLPCMRGILISRLNAAHVPVLPNPIIFQKRNKDAVVAPPCPPHTTYP